MAKLNIVAATVAAMAPLLSQVVEGSGKLWDASRDAYLIALKDFPKPADAVAAMRQVVTDTLKANAGSLKAYTSHLAWLSTEGKQTPEQIAKLSMADATNLRYPKPAKPGEPGFLEYAQKRNRDAIARKEKADKEKEEEQARNATPRGQLLHQIGQLLGDCDEAELSLIAAELVSIIGTLRSVEEPEIEQEQAEAA